MNSGVAPLDRVDLLFDRTRAGMSLESVDGRLLRVNDRFCRIMRADREELVGARLADLLQLEDVDADAAMRRHVLEDGALAGHVELRLRTDDRRAAWVAMSRVLVWGADGEALMLVTETTEIRERKREETLERLSKEATERELMRSNEELAVFASVVAHDLRSPLQVISGFASLLSRVEGKGLGDQGLEFVRWISWSAAQMETLIDGLLTVARVDAEPGPALVDLGSVVQDVATALEARAAASGATVTWGPLPVVTGDRIHLNQLLHNLVANAVTFVHPGVAPVVHIAAERTDGGWCIAVSDNGIGIDPVVREEVFNMFTRLNPDDGYEGAGMGLAICKRIVERAGGRIWVDAASGGGSIFRVVIPDTSTARSGSPRPTR